MHLCTTTGTAPVNALEREELAQDTPQRHFTPGAENDIAGGCLRSFSASAYHTRAVVAALQASQGHCGWFNADSRFHNGGSVLLVHYEVFLLQRFYNDIQHPPCVEATPQLNSQIS